MNTIVCRACGEQDGTERYDGMCETCGQEYEQVIWERDMEVQEHMEAMQ
jgi:Zn finger protein HypA/HybF involved in hydrogenase expression